MPDSDKNSPVQFPRRALLAYLGFTFGVAWTCWLVPILVQQQFIPLFLPASWFIFAGTFAPSAAAFIVAYRYKGKAGLFYLVRQARPKGINAIWYLIAIAGPILVMLASVNIYVLLGGNPPNYPAPGRWPLALINLVLVFVIGGPLGEEFGWRGLALPQLQTWLGKPGAGILVGSIWALWHVPLFFIPESPQYTLPIPAFFMQSIAISLIMAWMYNGAQGRLLPVMLLHAAINTFAQPLGILPAAAGSVLPFLLSVAIITVWALFISLFKRGSSNSN